MWNKAGDVFMRCKYAYVKGDNAEGRNLLHCTYTSSVCPYQYPCRERENYYKNTLLSVECAKTVEGKIGQPKCNHEFVFDTQTKTLVYPSIINGVCTKCGKQKKVSYEDYKNMKRSGNDEYSQ